MSGKLLASSLKALGFPGVEKFDPEDLDWMFENEAMSPMLEWFCQNVGHSNVLETKVLKEFESLTNSGEVILKGRQLDDALNDLDIIDDGDDNVTEESLKSDIQELSSNLQHYKNQKLQLDKRRNLLSDHHGSLSHRLSKLSVTESKVKQEYKSAIEQSHTVHAQMNESLENLTKAVTELSHLYKPESVCEKKELPSLISKSSLPGQTGSPAMFLSQVPIQQYYNVEEEYTTQLTAYTRKQFFQGISEMASCGEHSRFELLEVSDPDSLLIRGEDEDVNIHDCKELARLQHLYPTSETERVKSLLEMKRLKNEVQTAKQILDSLKTGTFSKETLKNKEKVQKLQSNTQVVKREFHTLAETEVPRLIQECKSAKVLRVLTGDYNLKLARQDYFTANQDKVIGELVRQRSRNEFITMLLEIELRKHREIHHIMMSLYKQLHDQFVQHQNRLSVMSDSLLTPVRHKRETIDIGDKTSARLYHCLDEGRRNEEKQLFLTYSSLVENGNKLHQKYNDINRLKQSLNSNNMENIHTLERSLHRCEDLVFAGSSTGVGFPLLTPRSIQDSIIQLKSMLEQLEQGILDVVKDNDSKKKLLKNDALLAREKKLYTYFFTNPAKLHKTLEEISNRLQAESNMNKS
ncbi:HAUS augmin-like complex subunit 3 [Mactra antiquata]